MANFYTIFGLLAVNSLQSSDPGSFDIISSLPVEVATDILRQLSGKDLVNCARVCRRWRRLIKGDRKLRRRTRLHVRQEHKARRDAVLYGSRAPTRQDAGSAFPIRNTVNNSVGYQPAVSYGRYVPYDPNYIVWKKKKVSSSLKRKNRSTLLAHNVRV